MAKDNTYELKFNLSNGDIITAGSIVAPHGDKGDKGDKGEQGIQGVQGKQGVKGDTGEEALFATSVRPITEDPVEGVTNISIHVANLNREPIIGESGLVVLKHATENKTWIAMCTVESQNALNFVFKIASVVLTTGTKGDTGARGAKGDKGETGATGETGPQGPQGEKGDPFTIARVFSSVSAMQAGAATDGVAIGSFVTIDTGNINDADNAKLYYKTANKVNGYTYLTDLSGATGIQGPQGAQGVKGDKGAKGDTGNVSLFTSDLVSIAGQPTAGTTGIVTRNQLNREPVIGEPFIALFYLTSSPTNTYIATCTLTSIHSSLADTYNFEVIDCSALKGEKGDKGIQGAQGATGPQGVSVVSASLTLVS